MTLEELREYNELKKNIKSLTDSEKERYKELKSLIVDSNAELMTSIEYNTKLNDLQDMRLREYRELDKQILKEIDSLHKQYYSHENLLKLRKQEFELSKQVSMTDEEIAEKRQAIVDARIKEVSKLSELERMRGVDMSNQISEINKKYEEQDRVFMQSIETASKGYENIKKEIEDINYYLQTQASLTELSTALFGENAEAVSKIGKFIGINNHAMTQFAQHLVAFKFKEAFSVIQAGFKGATLGAKAFGDALKANPIGAIIEAVRMLKAAFDFLKDTLFAQNKEIVQMQRNLMISDDAARDLRSSFVDMQSSSSNMYVTTKNLVEALGELNEALGPAIQYNQQMLEDQIVMTKQVGLTTEEAGNLQKVTLLTGSNWKDISLNVTKATMETKKQTGITWNAKMILSEISKLSSATLLSLLKYPGALEKTVIKSKELGISMNQMNSMADKLLDIESSLEAQFEASVLARRDFNFEKARELALNNQIGEAADEVLKSYSSAAEFGKENRVVQESIAKAMGMTRDELASSLVTRENLNKLGAEQLEQFNKLTAHMTAQEKAAKAAEMHDAVAAQKTLEKMAAQEKLNQLQEKFTAILTDVLAAFEPILDIVVAIFKGLQPVIRAVSWILDKLKYINIWYWIGQAGIGGDEKTSDAEKAAVKARPGTQMAEGGIVPATPGGRAITVAEAGQAEAIIPLDKIDSIVQNSVKNAMSQKETKTDTVGLKDVITAINNLTNAIVNNPAVLKVDGREFSRVVRDTTDPRFVRA